MARRSKKRLKSETAPRNTHAKISVETLIDLEHDIAGEAEAIGGAAVILESFTKLVKLETAERMTLSAIAQLLSDRASRLCELADVVDAQKPK